MSKRKNYIFMVVVLSLIGLMTYLACGEYFGSSRAIKAIEPAVRLGERKFATVRDFLNEMKIVRDDKNYPWSAGYVWLNNEKPQEIVLRIERSWFTKMKASLIEKEIWAEVTMVGGFIFDPPMIGMKVPDDIKDIVYVDFNLNFADNASLATFISCWSKDEDYIILEGLLCSYASILRNKDSGDYASFLIMKVTLPSS